MIASILHLWRTRKENSLTLYAIIGLKAVIVALLLFILWAIEGKNSAPIYMRF